MAGQFWSLQPENAASTQLCVPKKQTSLSTLICEWPLLAQSSRSSALIREEVLPGLWCVLTNASCACRTRDREPLKKLFGSLSGAGTRSKLFSVNALSVLLGKACRHPLVLGSMVERGTQPGAGTSLAGLNNSRCCSRIGCYGISGRPFTASD